MLQARLCFKYQLKVGESRVQEADSEEAQILSHGGFQEGQGASSLGTQQTTAP